MCSLTDGWIDTLLIPVFMNNKLPVTCNQGHTIKSNHGNKLAGKKLEGQEKPSNDSCHIHVCTEALTSLNGVRRQDVLYSSVSLDQFFEGHSTENHHLFLNQTLYCPCN